MHGIRVARSALLYSSYSGSRIPWHLVLCSAPSVPQPVFTIMEKAPTRAFSWLKAPTSTFTFKTLLRHYAKPLNGWLA